MAALKPHILFVDDEPPVREMLTLYFRKKGFDVTTATTIKEAVESVDKGSYDAAILDINLAEENGLELLGIIRKKHEKLPVIMFTAMGEDRDLLDQAMAAGAKGFMCKTETLETLFNEVCRHLPKPVSG
jgi:DNA-binding response OmpR family regulator